MQFRVIGNVGIKIPKNRHVHNWRFFNQKKQVSETCLFFVIFFRKLNHFLVRHQEWRRQPVRV